MNERFWKNLSAKERFWKNLSAKERFFQNLSAKRGKLKERLKNSLFFF
jgi:hypothetical protein